MKMSDSEILRKFSKKPYWGLSTAVDLYNCNPQTIRSEAKIKEFVLKLCKLIDMKRFGETKVVDFGSEERVSGFSMTQLIETSLISGHFANKSNAAYLDIFSCKQYPPYKTAGFCRKFFGAKSAKIQISFRR